MESGSLKFKPEVEKVEALQAGTSGWFAAYCRCRRASGAHASAQETPVSESEFTMIPIYESSTA